MNTPRRDSRWILLFAGVVIAGLCWWLLRRSATEDASAAERELERRSTVVSETSVESAIPASASRTEVEAREAVELPELQVVEARELTWIRVVEAARGTGVGGASLNSANPRYSHVCDVTDLEGFVQFDVEAVREEFSALDGRELRELWGFALRVDAAGYASSIVRLESGHATRESAQVVSLQRESALLFVLMAANGDPLVGASVRVSGKALGSTGDWLSDAKRERVVSMQLDPLLGTMRLAGGLGAQDWHAMSDASGLANVRGLPSEIPLSVVISGFGFTHEVELTPSKLFLGEDRVVEWRCPASGKVQGRLVAWEGLDLSRFHVALVAAGTRTTPTAFLEENEPLLSQSKARADGTFEFEGVPLGEYYCGLVPNRHPAGLAPAQRLALTAVAPDTAVTLTLDRGAAIDGSVAGVADSRETITLELHRDGVPGGIELRCSSSTGFRFHAEPLPPGTYTIRGRGNMGSVVVPIEATTGEFVTVSVEHRKP
jgi:hypothetical protein